MNSLYWYSTSYNEHLPFSRLVIASKGFRLTEEKVVLPNFKQLIFQKGTQSIEVILYESTAHQETFLFVLECDVKEAFIHHIQSKKFSGFYRDMFLPDGDPHEIIAQIEASIQYFEDDEVLHIYGQQMWHDDAFIIGNRAALMRLRDQIDEALMYDEKKNVFSPNDEEGFDLYVACIDDDFDWEQLDEPYHDPEIFKKRKRPIEAFKHYKLEK